MMELPREPRESGAGRSMACGGWRPHDAFVFFVLLVVAMSDRSDTVCSCPRRQFAKKGPVTLAVLTAVKW